MKPDFFEDEDVGLLSREARLLFVASWTLADDEGLVRWAVPYLKANVFMYDDDLGADEVQAVMAELEDAQMVFSYRGGRSQQRFGWIVNFRRHQKINRPQPGRLPAPSIQNPEVVAAYCRRDEWRCAICGGAVEEDPIKRAGVHKFKPSLDHIIPRSEGGTDYPSNLRLAHQGCNSSRGTTPVEESVNNSLNDSLSRSVPDVELEVEVEEEGNREEEVEAAPADFAPVIGRLDAVSFARQISPPKVAAAVKVCEDFADRDLSGEVEKFAHYWTEGPGESRPLSDVAWAWRGWLGRTDAPSQKRPASGSARDTVGDDLKRLEAEAQRLRAEEAAA